MKTEIIPEAVYRKITAEEAHYLMASSENYILLDVRTEEEYKEQRIEDTVLLPDYEIAANELIGMGYNNVYDFGGIIDWPYETIND